LTAHFFEGRSLGDGESTLRLLRDAHKFSKDITVFVPCLNEEASIYQSLENIRVAAGKCNVSYEIHVFDDGSIDRSMEEIKRFADDCSDVQMTVVRNDRAHGLAINCFDSSFMAEGKYHRMGWGDNVDSVENYIEIFRNLDSTDILVINYNVTQGKPFFRNVLSATYTKIIQTISGYKIGYFNGGNCIPTILLRRYHVESRGFGFQADLLTRLLDAGATHRELKLISHERASGSSSALKIRNWLSVAWMLMRMTVRRLKRSLGL